MLKQQAFKFELKTNSAQRKAFSRHAGCRRFVFNKGLELQSKNYKDGNKYLSYADMCLLLPAWKKEHPFLSEAPSQVLQQALKDLDTAFKRFFKKLGAYPVFKKKGLNDSFRFPSVKSSDIDSVNSRIKLPKSGWVKFRQSRKILGTPKNMTLSTKVGKWFISVQTEMTIDVPVPKATSSVGIDLGIARFATLSNGEFIKPLNSFKSKQVKLARYQRAMSRKVKFSKNWIKAKKKVSKLHHHIANCRKDFLHKASNDISNNHAMIAVEALKVSNMSASASGTKEEPGKNVKAKSGLNKAILDQGWYEFKRQLIYKAAWKGGFVVEVPAHYTSQTCPCCGHVSTLNRKTQAKFGCMSCGFEENADVVGALNILNKAHKQMAAGHAASACGAEPLGSAEKQEPAEETCST